MKPVGQDKTLYWFGRDIIQPCDRVSIGNLDSIEAVPSEEVNILNSRKKTTTLRPEETALNSYGLSYISGKAPVDRAVITLQGVSGQSALPAVFPLDSDKVNSRSV